MGDNFKCDMCGHDYVHLGKGVFVCPKCGNEISFSPERFSEEGDMDFGYTWEDLWGDKPECCSTCSIDNYPDCRERCALIEHDD